MPRGWRLRIEDILEAIANIQEDIGKMNFELFLKDTRVLDNKMIKINELKSIFISKIAKFLKIRLKCEF